MIQETWVELYEQMSYVRIRAVGIGGNTQATNVDKYCLCTTLLHSSDHNVCVRYGRAVRWGEFRDLHSLGLRIGSMTQPTPPSHHHRLTMCTICCGDRLPP